MLTTEGKNQIRRYLAGYVPNIASTMAFGIGTRAEALGDIALQLETTRSQVAFISYDFASNKLVWKAPIQDTYAGKVYEVGLYTIDINPDAGDFGSRLITPFDSADEDWIDVGSGLDASFNSTNTRVGTDSLRHTPALSTTATASLANIAMDFSGFSGADGFTFAYNVGNANTSQISFRFLTDASNYYRFDMGAQTAGYKVVETTKSAALVTGTPNWSTITEIRVLTTSAGTGASQVDYDAIRIEDKDTTNLDYILVARKVLVTPFTKVDGQPLDCEFSLDVAL